MKTKFKMTKEEMLNFNDDCNNACGQSPGYRNEWAIEDRDICLGNITAKAVEYAALLPSTVASSNS